MHDDVMHEVVIQSDLNEEQEPHESFTVFFTAVSQLLDPFCFELQIPSRVLLHLTVNA